MLGAACISAILLVAAAPARATGGATSSQSSMSSMEFTTPPPVQLTADPADKGTSIPSPVRAGPAARALGASTATFEVTYDSNFTDEAKAAFQEAVNIWSQLVVSSVPIRVNATFLKADDASNLGSAGATSSVRNFTGADFTDTWYPVTLAEAMAGKDLNSGAADIGANFNSGRTDWYFGTDGATPAGKYDFESVVLHELGHGLGFYGSAYVTDTGQGGWGISTGDEKGTVNPMIFDRFTQDLAKKYLAGPDYTNGSFALGSALKSGNVYFSGPLSFAENVYERLRLYAPSAWDSGSSYSHLDESAYPAGTANSLMTPFLGGAESVHAPGPLALCLMEDMGWDTSEVCAAPPRPANDNFSAAQTISGISGSVTGTTIAASREPGEPHHEPGVTTGAHSIWYRWTAPTTGRARFALCGSSFATMMRVYTGTSVHALTATPQTKAYDCWQRSVRLFDAREGTTYHIAVDGYAGASGTVALGWSMTVPPPSNDAFSSTYPAFLSSGFSAFHSNYGATKEPGEPNHAGNPGGHSIWYSFAARQDGIATVDTCGSGFDTVLAAYTGNAVSSLTTVASNDDSNVCGPGSKQSRLSFTALSGVSYFIAVDGYGGAQGKTVLRFQNTAPPPPANDHFDNAKLISGTSGTDSAHNLSATKQAGEPNHAGNSGGRSVWYRWVAPATGTATFDTCVSTFNTVLAAYEGVSLDRLTSVASSDDSPACGSGSVQSQVSFRVLAGLTYKVAVDGAGGTVGNFGLRWNLVVPPPPANDSYTTPKALTGASGSVTGSNTAATRQFGEPYHDGQPGGRSVWFSLKAVGTGTITIDTCGSSFDTLLGVYTGSGFTPVASDDDNPACGPWSASSRVSFTPVHERVYLIAVDGYKDANGQYKLQWLQRPPNDAFATPQLLAGPDGTIAAGTTLATKEAGEPKHAGNAGGKSVWYRWVAPSAGRATFDTCGSGFDTVLAVYTGNAVNALTPVASNNDDAGCGGTGRQSRVSLVPQPGKAYLIAVDGLNAAGGPLTFHWQQAPGNDDFAAGSLISGSGGTAAGTTRNATAQPGEPGHHTGNVAARSVWYRWTAPSSGSVTFDTCGSGFDTVLAVYTGSTVNGLASKAQNDDMPCNGRTSNQSSVTLPATAGTTYRIAIDGFRGASGPTVLRWTLRPGNDSFAAPTRLSGSSGTIAGTTTNATREPGEPRHAANNQGGSSVWYSWIAPSAGSVTFDTCGSAFDTLLGVYHGSTLTSLTRAASDDDGCGTPRTSRVTFKVVAGRTYRIAVDGFNGASGSTRVRWCFRSGASSGC